MVSPLNQLVGQSLTWVPTATFRSSFSLVAPDNTTLATLDMSGWRSKASATVPEGSLFIQPQGWSTRNIAVYAFENGPLLATYQGKWFGTSGQLSFPDDRALLWHKVNFWGNQKAWTDPASDSPYVQFSSNGFSRKASVTLYPEAAALPDLSLLVVMGLYNILIERRNEAAASAATST
ncbi:hypothetical protein [Dictyobacter aurantiacus]|uniref:Uncharacterized protein n=1 Tax=Dictyobacter aurantiacus TaxID=1936993 RepID=A0A401ZJM8_9CHLR|nr:hypothetical protein [Dictyobacter aurantiacus]GCE07053.1 hypothetical protein KDAU_43820 [Dictyobacter aurantiacus]